MAEPVPTSNKLMGKLRQLARTTGLEIPAEVIGAGTIATMGFLLRQWFGSPTPTQGGAAKPEKLGGAIARIQDADLRARVEDAVRSYPNRWKRHLEDMSDADLDATLGHGPREIRRILLAELPLTPFERAQRAAASSKWILPYMEEGARLDEEARTAKDAAIQTQVRRARFVIGAMAVVAAVIWLAALSLKWFIVVVGVSLSLLIIVGALIFGIRYHQRQRMEDGDESNS